MAGVDDVRSVHDSSSLRRNGRDEGRECSKARRAEEDEVEGEVDGGMTERDYGRRSFSEMGAGREGRN